VWDALCSQVDKLDKQALKPVARVVERLRERSSGDQEIAA